MSELENIFKKLNISIEEKNIPVAIADKINDSIAQINAALPLKADDSTIYTKAETDGLLDSKATASSGTAAPTSTPAKAGDIYVDTTNYKTYISKGSSSTSDWIKQNGSYALQSSATAGNSPTDSSTYYFGQGLGWTSNAGYRKMFIPKTGIIKSAFIFFEQSAGTSETSSLYIRVNGTTDYLISNAIKNDAGINYFSNIALSISVSSGDYIEFKWITPIWATNPTALHTNFSLNIDL